MKPTLKLKHVLTTLLGAGTTGLKQLDVVTPYHGYQMKHFPGQFWSFCLNADISAAGDTGVAISRRNEPCISQNATQKQELPRLFLLIRPKQPLHLCTSTVVGLPNEE